MRQAQHEYLAAVAHSLLNHHRVPTPFLFIDENEVIESVKLLKTSLPQAKIFYSAKANASPQVIQLIRCLGLSLDVSSAAEIMMAHALGIKGKQVFLSAPFKTLPTMEALFKYEVGAVSVDTVGEVERLASFRMERGIRYNPRIFVRIRLDSTDVAIDLNTKFGCSASEALAVIQRITAVGMELGGICFHVGTQSTNAQNHLLGIKTAMLVAEAAEQSLGVRVPTINIGGGFCDPAAALRQGLSLREMYRQIGDACREAQAAGYEIYAEPGRSLVASAGTVVTSVIGTCVRNGQRWIYLDDGVYGCYSLKLYERPPLEFYALRSIMDSESSAHNLVPWTVAGPSCCSLDVIAGGVQLPEDIEVGDIVISPNLGAYSTATATTFNGLPVPKAHLVRPTVEHGKLKTQLLNEDFVADETESDNSRPSTTTKKSGYRKERNLTAS